MGDYHTFMGDAQAKLITAGNHVHTVDASRDVLLAALYDVKESVVSNIKALLWLKRYGNAWDFLEHSVGVRKNLESDNISDLFRMFSKIATSCGIGLSDMGKLQEILKYGQLHTKEFDSENMFDDHYILGFLNFEHFLDLFECATQLYEKVSYAKK